MLLTTWLSTIKHLKIRQLFYFVYYRLKINKIFIALDFSKPNVKVNDIKINFSPLKPRQFKIIDNKMYLLNKEMRKSPNWENQGYGKLWNYNLHYFDYIFHPEFPQELARNLIKNYHPQKVGIEPYPITIRGMNWVKYFISQNYFPDHPVKNLYDHYKILFHSIEYQHNANHLLENGISLFVGGIFFQNIKFINRSLKILKKEFIRQFFSDGAHFELSPMYQRVMIGHLLDAYSLTEIDGEFGPIFEKARGLIYKQVRKMIQWLANIEIKDNIFPEFGDSVNDYGPSFTEIKEYCKKLGIESPDQNKLNDSGVRVIRGNNFVFTYKLAPVSPDCNPGHSHSDLLSFELYVNGKPILVDSGVSTYDNIQKRHYERSILAHNSVSYEDQDQNQFWDKFRVGKRSKILHSSEIPGKEITTEISSLHKKCKSLTRIVKFNSSRLAIHDKLMDNSDGFGYFLLHFAPEIDFVIKNFIIENEYIQIRFDHPDHIHGIAQKSFNKALSFNKVESAQMLVVKFESELNTEIIIK